MRRPRLYIRASAAVHIAWYAVVRVTICKAVGHDNMRIDLGEYGHALCCHNCKDFKVPTTRVGGRR